MATGANDQKDGAPFGDLLPEDIRVLETLRGRLGPLVSNLTFLREQMRMPTGAPPDWPSIHRSTSMTKTHLKSLHDFLNSEVEKSDGNFTTYGEILSRLRAYPTPPFPATLGKQGFVGTILRKRLEPQGEKWVEDRIRKAQEFCDVPNDFGIEPRAEVDEADESADDGNHEIKRIKTELKENDLLDVWQAAGRTALAQYELFDMVVKRSEDRDELPESRLEQIDALRAELGMDDEEEGDEEEDGEELKGEQGTMKLDPSEQVIATHFGQLLSFMSTGE